MNNSLISIPNPTLERYAHTQEKGDLRVHEVLSCERRHEPKHRRFVLTI